MIFVWFIYGLAFFVFGLAIAIYPKKGSAFKLANSMWLIAGFGVLHGINEWLDMFIAIGEPFPPGPLKVLRIITLSGSFLFLLQFGIKVIFEGRKKYHFIEATPVVLFITWVAILVLSKQHLLIGDISARYLLCAPGSFLTALALFQQIPQFKKTKLFNIVRNLRLAAITFVFYGVLAGLVVKKASFFGANFLNYDLFKETFGIPVQVFRALCAITLAYSITYVLSIFRWETKETLYKSEQRFSSIVATTPIILFVQDCNSIITFIQGKGLELLGRKSEDIVGHSISQVFPSVLQLAEDSSRALSGEEFVTTVTIDGVIFEFCYSPLRDNDGEVIGIIGVALDVTAKMQTQEKLDKYRSEMEKNARLAEVGTMGEMMAQQLDEPLAVTQLLLQRLQSDFSRVSAPENIAGNLKKSLSEVSRAIDIVDKFHSAAQVSGKTSAEPVDLYQIAKRVITVCAQNAQRANLKIVVKDIDVVPYMSIAAHELEQIFFILVQNAIDTAIDINKPQKLTISCKAEDKKIELRFHNTASSIPQEKLQNIFEPFFSAKSGVSKAGGFGLAVAKQIVCNQGGNISAQCQPGEGTTFLVTLPVERVI